MNKINAFFYIFPNGDWNLFEHKLRMNKNNVKDAIYSYGLWYCEMDKYEKEINELEQEILYELKGGIK